MEPYSIANLGVMKDYDYSETHKRERLILWTGPFASVREGEAYSLPKGDGYMVSLEYGGKVRVTCPTPREDGNYQEIDEALRVAMNEHYAAKGDVVLSAPDQDESAAYPHLGPELYKDGDKVTYVRGDGETMHNGVIVGKPQIGRDEPTDPDELVYRAYRVRYAGLGAGSNLSLWPEESIVSGWLPIQFVSYRYEHLRTVWPLHLDVLYPSQLKPGMLVLGTYEPDAPTRPVQPMATALEVFRIEPSEQEGVEGFRILWVNMAESGSPWYPLYGTTRFLVLSQ